MAAPADASPPRDDQGWVEVRATVDAGGAPHGDLDTFLEPLCAVARTLSPGGVVIEGDDAPPGPLAPPPTGHARVRVWVRREELGEALTLVRGAVEGGGYPGAQVETEALDPGWRERWKEGFRGFHATPKLWVRPPWEGPGPKGVAEVVIEPGMAFGTGQHETTRLCLDALDALVEPPAGPPAALLDVGCGTGIVAIAAAKLGAPRVRGVDVAPDAVRAARDNAARNGLHAAGVGQPWVLLDDTPLGDLQGLYPVVIVNILAHVLLPLRDDVVARVAQGGALYVTGLLASQEAQMVEAFSVRGLSLTGRAQRGEWVRLDFRRAP